MWCPLRNVKQALIKYRGTQNTLRAQYRLELLAITFINKRRSNNTMTHLTVMGYHIDGCFYSESSGCCTSIRSRSIQIRDSLAKCLSSSSLEKSDKLMRGCPH